MSIYSNPNEVAPVRISTIWLNISVWTIGRALYYYWWQHLFRFPVSFIILLDGRTYSYFHQVAAPLIIPLDGSIYSFFTRWQHLFLFPPCGLTLYYSTRWQHWFLFPPGGSTFHNSTRWQYLFSGHFDAAPLIIELFQCCKFYSAEPWDIDVLSRTVECQVVH